MILPEEEHYIDLLAKLINVYKSTDKRKRNLRKHLKNLIIYGNTYPITLYFGFGYADYFEEILHILKECGADTPQFGMGWQRNIIYGDYIVTNNGPRGGKQYTCIELIGETCSVDAVKIKAKIFLPKRKK